MDPAQIDRIVGTYPYLSIEIGSLIHVTSGSEFPFIF
jgi:hypothetical protein